MISGIDSCGLDLSSCSNGRSGGRSHRKCFERQQRVGRGIRKEVYLLQDRKQRNGDRAALQRENPDSLLASYTCVDPNVFIRVIVSGIKHVHPLRQKKKEIICVRFTKTDLYVKMSIMSF